MDSGRSDWLAVPLAHRGPFCSAHRRRPPPPPPDITVAGATTDREWEYERAPQESQTVAVQRRGGAIGWSLVFGATSTILMLGQSTGTVYQPGMAQSVALGHSDGSVALATPQQQYPPRYSSIVSSSAKATPMPIPRGSGELGGRCTKRAGRVICQWRVEASTCHWRQTVNTGGGRGVTRCGRGASLGCWRRYMIYHDTGTANGIHRTLLICDYQYWRILHNDHHHRPEYPPDIMH